MKKKKVRIKREVAPTRDLELLDLLLLGDENGPLSFAREEIVLAELRARGVYQEACWDADCDACSTPELAQVPDKLLH